MFSRSPRLAPVDTGPPENLNQKIESLKCAITDILAGTEWPSESESTATSLLATAKSSPNVQKGSVTLSQELEGAVKEYLRLLEGIRLRLKDASSKASMQKWNVLQLIKSMTSNRPSKCTLLLKTCQDDLSKAINSLKKYLDQERANDDLVDRRITPAAHSQSDASKQHLLSVPLQLHSKLTEHRGGLDGLPPSTAEDENTLSRLPENNAARNPIRKEALTAARRTFKSVDLASGSIPVVGGYVGAVAKVGLAFVETIETMDRNDDLANDLGAQTTKLSKLLEGFMNKRNASQGEEIADHLGHLHRELGDVHDQVKQWKSLGRFSKAFNSRDHAEALKSYQGTVKVALEEMQLLVSLDTHDSITELRDRQLQEQQRRLLRCLGDGKYGAQGNAVEDVICFPGTRVEILERVDGWIGDSSDRVLWIRGMAGRGKSTVASTVVHSWKYRASCAIFHFRRGQNTLNTRIVCALARQLATSLIPEVKNAILDSVRENEDIADQRLKEQFETLLVSSLAGLKNQSHPILIVVDALDECDNLKDAIDFVSLIDRHSAAFPSNVKFLLTCRPEAPLLRALEPRKWNLVDLDAVADVNDDLKRFIEQALQQIRDLDSDVPTDWPSPKDVERLVEMSQGLFQWARTAITYVSNGSPVDRLRELLVRPSMWSGLDDLYHQILFKAFDNVRLDPIRRDILRSVLGALVVAPYPVSLEVIASLYGKHQVFDATDQQYIIVFLRKDILADLNSLLFIPPSIAKPMHLMHTSIRDLITSKNRCEQQPYYIDLVPYHLQLTNKCFDVMREHLKENICGVSDLSKPSSEIQTIVERNVSQVVRYGCRAWSTHLTEGVSWPESGENSTTIDLAEFESFSKERVIFWIEAMGLIGATGEAINMGRCTHQWLLRLKGVEDLGSLATLWNDVQRFITAFSEPISFSPLHLYVSGLPHCPTETEIWRLYGKYAKVQTLRGLRTTTWQSNLWTRSAEAWVWAVAFSPDGQVLASGSEDGTIQLWDTQTGMSVGEPLAGHDGAVLSVCYSPDGKVLASGSKDNTIRLWDTRTGAAMGDPLTGYTWGVNSASFSPDGNLLASGSGDATIRLWDALTGAPFGEPLTGHTRRVGSVCFSPNGNILASGSDDNTIRLWDTRTRAAAGEPLTGHTYCVMSICFSPEGKVLASGSLEEIRLWDAWTGAAVGEPLRGHSGWVRSVCFSPDGNVLASGSDDNTIRLWDSRTGAPAGGPLTGHTSNVLSVCFSPHGSLLVSGSFDKTVRLWDTRARASVGEPHPDHTQQITSVGFSPDYKVLVSGSADGTLRLWDTRTGAAVGEQLTGHTARVNSVSFSPGGDLLASGSNDHTIRLWDTRTGSGACEPLTNHTGWVNSVRFSPDGNVLASGSHDWTIRLWNTRTGAAVGEPLTGHTYWVRSVCFSPDGKVLASGSNDNTVRVWDTWTGAAVGEPLVGHPAFVVLVSFSPDGTVLASGSFDGEIRLWNAQTGAAVAAPLKGRSIPRSFHFSPDKTLLTTNYRDGSSDSWSLITHQRCESLHHPSLNNHPSFENHWILLSYSRFFWVPPQYWGDVDRVIALFDGRLVVRSGGELGLFDVSQILAP